MNPLKKLLKRIRAWIYAHVMHGHNISPSKNNATAWLQSSSQSIDQLVDSINASARVIAAEFSVMLLIALILSFTLVVTNDTALIFKEDIALPQGIAKMNIVDAYRFLPLVFFFMHIILLSMLNVVSMKIRALNQVLPSDIARLRLLPYSFLRIHFTDSYFLMRLLAFFGIAFIPLGLLVTITGTFLRYQHEPITLIHQTLVCLDGFLLIIFYYRILRSSSESLKSAGKEAAHMIHWRFGRILENSLYIALILFVTIFVLGNASVLKQDDKDPRDAPYHLRGAELFYHNWFDGICIKTNDYETRWGCRYILSKNEDLFIPPSKELLSTIILNDEGKKNPEALRDSKMLKELKQHWSKGLDLRKRSFRFADFRETTLVRADFTGASLEEAIFFKASLEGADFTEANLEDARFHGAHLEGVDFRKAILKGADLREAILTGADLREAILPGADLRKAILKGADLREAILTGADLREAHCDNNTNFKEAYLVNVQWSNEACKRIATLQEQ